MGFASNQPAQSRPDAFNFLGIKIAAIGVEEAVERTMGGGLFLAPSGPGLCDIAVDKFYREALEGSDLNLPDSGLAIFLMRFLGLGNLPRVSGLGFLKALLERSELKISGSTFWVMPSEKSMVRNLRWLNEKGLLVGESDCHIAPPYPATGPVLDPVLLNVLAGRRPRFLFVCTGSGSQEKLGFWLKQNLPGRPAICCIGAAIAFLSGDQVGIPVWADRVCLGWFYRCRSEPAKFVPRYLSALRLVGLAWKYRDRSPAGGS